VTNRSRFGIAVFAIGTGLLFARTNSPNEQKQQTEAVPPSQPSPADVAQPYIRPAYRFCSPKNPPPCTTPPKPVFSPDPEYSKEAREAHLEGSCVLLVTVGTDGRVRDLKVVRSLGLGLNQKAMDALKRWVFQPAMNDGIAVAVQIAVEVSFQLYSVVVSPTSARVATGERLQFTATTTGATDSTVKWSVSGLGCVASSCGSISDGGLYTAPSSVPTPATVTVTAVSAADPKKTGSASVNLYPNSPK